MVLRLTPSHPPARSATPCPHRTAPPLVPAGSVALSPEPAAPETAPPDTDVLEKEDDGSDTDAPWSVVLFNDDVHTFQEVIRQIVKATGCTSSKAEQLAWTVHTKGKATVYEGSFQDCFDVQSVLKEIDLVTEIQG